MRTQYRPKYTVYSYTVDLYSNVVNDWWAYPMTGRYRCGMYAGKCIEYGDPPSHELRTLIEVAAPWYVVIDKLIEEYPQWQSHLEAAAAAELQRMGVA